jgi:hypothetical protein
MASIRTLLSKGNASASDLNQLIGRWNHAGYIIPMLSGLRKALGAAERQGGRTSFTDDQKADLWWWISSLALARSGISMNLLTFRPPTHIFRVDACEHGNRGVIIWTVASVEVGTPFGAASVGFLAVYLVRGRI